MKPALRSPRNFWAGLLYAALGVAAIVVARDYGMGTAARMGPAYFPSVLGGLLALVGVASMLRSVLVDGEAVGRIAWKAAALVTLGTVLFGVLLRPAGLVPALAVLILVSAAASLRFRLEARALALMAALIAFCALVFVKALGLPLPLVGPLLGG